MRIFYFFDKCLICFRISGILGIIIILMNVIIISVFRFFMVCDEVWGLEVEIVFWVFDDRVFLLRSSLFLSLLIYV